MVVAVVVEGQVGGGEIMNSRYSEKIYTEVGGCCVAHPITSQGAASTTATTAPATSANITFNVLYKMKP